ncbi:MAG: hypothetical protein LM577_07590 [Thermoproteaceae archaeon]|nr:hypothetical protein [Thermoproteaceae archaeon]
MLEEMLREWARLALRSGRRGWVLVRDGKIVGAFSERRDAIAAAREPGVYVLQFVE